MRRAIVHIGLPRTGTTSFQRVLYDRRQALSEHGILYPDLTPRSETVPHLSHQHLGETLDGRRSVAERTELLDRLRQILRQSDADVVMLSYEGLWRKSHPLKPQAVPNCLRDLFGAEGFAMETLMTVKPQADYLNSLYTLRTQWLLETRDFAGFVQSQLGTRGIDYTGLLKSWRKACDGRVHMVPLRDAASSLGLVKRIFQDLGLLDRAAATLTGADLDRRDNSSPGPVAVEVARRLRVAGAVRPGQSIRGITRFIEDTARQAGCDRDSFNGVSADLKARIEAEYAESNNALARGIWHVDWSARVANSQSRPANEIAGHPVADAVEAAVQRVLRETSDQFGLRTQSRVLAGLRTAPTSLRDALLGRRAALS